VDVKMLLYESKLSG